MAKKNTPKKTLSDHSEDALYREVWEEVYAQKAYNFIRKHYRILIAVAVAVVLIVAGVVVVRQVERSNALEIANAFESAMDMNPALRREALSRLASRTRGGMGDLAMFRAYQLAIEADDIEGAVQKLERLIDAAATRDFKGLAIIHMAMIKGDEMSGAEFQKMMAPLLTKRSPFYFTGLMLVAQKYLSLNSPEKARPFLERIISDNTAPVSISAQAELLLR